MGSVRIEPTSKSGPRGRRFWWLLPLLAALLGGVVACGASGGEDDAVDSGCVGQESVARVWNETALNAIRRDFPAPTVHSHNLYHLSAALWDVWASYEPGATGLFFDEKREAENVEDERAEAMSFAAHRLLSSRYANSVGAAESLAEFDRVMTDLCFDPAVEPNDARAASFGLLVADQILADTRDDGSLEADAYIDPTYTPTNEPLVVNQPGAPMSDPNRWQPLRLAEQVTQNGQVIPDQVQDYIGPNWGFVTPFAIEPDPVHGLPIDPGQPPMFGVDDEEFIAAASQVVVYSSLLNFTDETKVDISPAALGNTPLGTYDPQGWDTNPDTGFAYEPNEVLEVDFARVIAEYWADGPESETPPGHWNTLANEVGDQLEAASELRIDGDPVDRLEWDVKIGLTMNGALHDAAIAAWGAKAYYDYARPISMIRYLGERALLNEIPGVIETITPESSAPGERHTSLAEFVGEQAVYTWWGQPSQPTTQVAGVVWKRAATWVPYQRASFVSPAFAAYVSGHSAFSRAAAEVLTEFTGSEFFPGGLHTHTVEPGGLIHESGPNETVELQWATYRDAADQAGISRLYGGIHVRADDQAGRKVGAEVGLTAIERARQLFGDQ